MRPPSGAPACRVLIGGYGMGFTLRAALAKLGADAQIIVAELVPAVMQWARGPMAGLTANCLDDPRVNTRETDVGDLIASARLSFDAILLDVDNGPPGLSRRANNRLTICAALKRCAQRFVQKACWRYGRQRPTRCSLIVLSARDTSWMSSRPAPAKAEVDVISSGSRHTMTRSLSRHSATEPVDRDMTDTDR